MWLMPAKSPDKVRMFFLGCRDMGISTPGSVLVQREHFKENEIEFLGVIAPPGWNYVATESDDPVQQVIESWPIYKESAWVGLLSESTYPLSINWDTILSNTINTVNVVVPTDDGKGASKHVGFGSIWSGDVLRAVGSLFFDGLGMDSQFATWTYGAYEAGALMRHSEIVVRSGQRPDGIVADDIGKMIAGAIEKLKADKGLIKYEVDLKGRSVMVAVPTGNGALDFEFLSCLHDTFAMFNSLGVGYELAIEPLNADLVMARSKLLARFRRSSYTDFLGLDEDMKWDVAAVQRLFAAKKEFVGIAGPKKKTPLQCAVTAMPLNRDYGRVDFDRESGTVEVVHVGAAFVLLQRSAVEKMCEAYPELAYTGLGNETEHCLYLPTVDPDRKQYLSEDYSFCKRWRDIGGHIYVCPDISLGHRGRKIYEGSWASTWPQVKPMQQEAAE